MAIELISYFEGDWTFTREIKTDKDKIFAMAKGNASFTKDLNPDSLFYSEDGELDLQQNKTKNPFYKNYLFSFFTDHITVYFSGGASSEQLYQEYRQVGNKITPVAEHVCNQDLYNSEFQMADQNQFEQITKITGPHKNFLITTIFNRVKIR